MLVARMVAALAVAGVLAAAAPAAASPNPPTDRQAVARAAALAAGPVLKSLDPDAAGKCLDAYNWGIGPWAQMYPCHGGANQVWTLNKGFGDGTLELFYSHQGTYKCLDGVAGRGQQLTVWGCDRSLGQRFRQRGATEFEMVLESVRYPGQCLDVSNWGRDAAVILWDCHLQANQVWSRTY